MKDAIVLCSGTGTNGEDLSKFPSKSIAQVPQLKRIIINCQRAGTEQFHIITDNAGLLKNLLIDDPRITSDINWVPPGESLSVDSGRVLILESSLVVTNSNSLEKFIRDSSDCREDEFSVLVQQDADPVVGMDRETGYVTKYFGGGSSVFGAFSVNFTEVPSVLSAAGLNTWLGDEATRNRMRIFSADSGYWYRLSDTKESRKEAERIIFSHVGKTATGWIARNINGRMSLPLSKLLIRTSLTPNAASVLINLIGVLCGPLYALGHPVLGALFMQVATVLDRCDGEVARIKLMETKKGQWVDTISDQFTVLSFLIGVPVGYYLQTGSTVAVILGTYNIIIFILFLIWSFYFLIKYTDSGSLVAYFEVDKHINPEELSLLRKLLARLRFLGRRNYYSAGLVLIAIIGGNSLVLFATSFALTLFLIHQLEDVITILRIGKPKEVLQKETEQG